MTPPRLVCLGNFTIDDVVLPDLSERPGCTGGDALYATLAARPWQPATELVAPIGADFPASIATAIAGQGLSNAGFARRDLPTLHNRVEYFVDGSRKWTLFAEDSAFNSLSPSPTDIPAEFRPADAFLILAMTLAAQQRLVADLTAAPGALVALDPQEDYIAGNEAAILRMIAAVDIFLPSAEEVLRLLGTRDWLAAARQFASLGPRLVVIKLGAEGCLVHERDTGRTTHVPAYAVETVVDTTGAGDSFCGAFMAAYLQEPDPVRAARAGAVAASVTVQGYGVDPLFAADSAEIRRRFESWAPECPEIVHPSGSNPA